MGKADQTTTLNQLKESVQVFCEDRDWDQFHSPNHLAVGVVTEAAELLELFRFLSDQDSKGLVSNPDLKGKVEEEMADVLFFLLRFAQMYDIDLSSSLADKIRKNVDKYPVELAKGSNKKYGDL